MLRAQLTPFLTGPMSVMAGLSLATAYQATDPAHYALVELNVEANASISLVNQTQADQRGELVISPLASEVVAGTGLVLGRYRNTQSGTLVITLVLQQTLAQFYSFILPPGWYFGFRQTVGANLTITSAFNQTVG